LSNIDTRGAKEAAPLDLAGLSSTGEIDLGIQGRDVKAQPGSRFQRREKVFACMRKSGRTTSALAAEPIFNGSR
jgi:hypothetical protein